MENFNYKKELTRPNWINYVTDVFDTIIVLGVIWAIFSLIAWDLNPKEWWAIGRFIYVVIVIGVILVWWKAISNRNIESILVYT